LSDLYLSVGEYISRNRAVTPKPITCTFQETYIDVIEKLVKNKVHRIFVVTKHPETNQDKPEGVLSLCDVLTILLGESF